MKNFLLPALLTVSFFVVNGQTDSGKTKELGEVIVTGQFSPQSVKNSVYQVRVVNNERIRLSGATNVQQVLANQLGIRFSNDNTLGTSDIELMGMSGRNVKILLDGVPLADRGDSRESLNQIDINSIERIEIVEGPMSVVYGSDALAGVINLITKKPGRNKFSVTARVQEESAGNEYYPFSYKGLHSSNLGLSWQGKGWNAAAGITRNDFSGFGGDEWGREKSWKPKEQWLGNARVGYTGSKFSVYYRLDGLNEDILTKGKINFNTYKAVDQQFITSRFTHQIQHDWRINEKLQLNGIIAYTDLQRKTRTVRHDFVTDTDQLTTGAGEQDKAKIKSFVFRPTLQFRISPLIALQTGIEINHEKASGERIAGNPEINDYSLFVSTEIKPLSRLNIRPGVRVIKNSVYDAPPLIPSVNARFAVNNNLDVRVAYAYGFRAPALRELYFTFHDANHDIDGNPNLKAENSNSFTGSFTWSKAVKKNIQFSSSLAGFYNVFNNQIAVAQSAPNSTLYTYFNIDKFKNAGGTWDNRITCSNISATLGFSYIGRYNNLADADQFKATSLPDFTWTPEVNSNIIYTFRKIGATAGFFYKYSGKRPGYQIITNSSTAQEEAQLVKIDSYHLMDLILTKSLLRYLTLTAGVKNLAGVTGLQTTAGTGGAHTGSGPLPFSYGRSFILGLNFALNR